MTVYYLVEQLDRDDGRRYVHDLRLELFLADARAYRRQILREKLADEVRIVRIDTGTLQAKVVR